MLPFAHTDPVAAARPIYHGPLNNPKIVGSIDWGHYEPPPPGTLDRQRIGVKYLLHRYSADSEGLQWLGDLLVAQLGEAEVGVASWGLYLLFCPEHIRSWFLESQWHVWPLSLMRPAIKGFLDQVRLSGVVQGAVDPIAQALYMRKIANPTARSLDDADWAQDASRATGTYSMRRGPNGRRHYLQMMWTALKRIAVEVVGSAPAGPTLETWWQERALNLPGGSSSLRKRNLLGQVEGRMPWYVDSKPRPNKQAVWEALPKEDVQSWLAGRPLMIARTSTKHEPGAKQRALYAQDDLSAWYAAYASYGLEKNVNVAGMVPSQRPADIAEWAAADKGNSWCDHWWLSQDYTDFNKDHSNPELALVNHAIAWAQSQAAEKENSSGRAQQALVSMLMAKAHRTPFVQGAPEVSGLSSSGLWSGHRNTARDNTMLHAAYQQVAVSMYPNLWKCRPIRTYICGDDEDSLFRDQSDALIYLLAHMWGGWHLNPSKQMLGKLRHEFLQWSTVPKISKPLAATVATLAMGNWYKMPRVDFRGLVTGAADHAVTLVSRSALPKEVEKAWAWVLGGVFMHHELRTANPVAIVVPPRSGKTTLTRKYGFLDVDATRSWEQTWRRRYTAEAHGPEAAEALDRLHARQGDRSHHY
nr:MAG: RNA-dependent RNA polymerase [Totiviridae sp.]